MSFGGESSKSEELPQFKKFVSQDELDEARQRRQEEWEKVRKPDEPLEAPEEEYDPRSLFDKLQDQKQKKDEDYAEQFKFSNQVRGLEEEEATFLNLVSEKQQELESKRHQEEEQLLAEYRDALTHKVQDKTGTTEKDKKNVGTSSSGSAQTKKSQAALLAGAVKRKSTDVSSGSAEKKAKEDEANDLPSENLPRNTESASGDLPSERKQTAKVIGILPGILPGMGAYSGSSDSDSSSSESDIETDLLKRPVVQQITCSAEGHTHAQS